jgi:hypothetical protein
MKEQLDSENILQNAFPGKSIKRLIKPDHRGKIIKGVIN